MTLSSYADVFNLDLDHAEPHAVRPGDLVSSGTNAYPYFEVLAVDGPTAWVRNTVTGSDHLAPLTRCRPVAADSLRHAA